MIVRLSLYMYVPPVSLIIACMFGCCVRNCGSSLVVVLGTAAPACGGVV